MIPMSIVEAVKIVLFLVCGGMVFWLLKILVDKSPMNPEWKPFVSWVLLALAILVLIGIILSFMTGVPLFRA